MTNSHSPSSAESAALPAWHPVWDTLRAALCLTVIAAMVAENPWSILLIVLCAILT
jgi:hypothetical protein